MANGYVAHQAAFVDCIFESSRVSKTTPVSSKRSAVVGLNARVLEVAEHFARFVDALLVDSARALAS